MALLTLHATCCDSDELTNVQHILNTSNLDDLDGVQCNDALLSKPYYIERMTDVCRDVIRLGYI